MVVIAKCMYDGDEILPPLVPFHFPNRKLLSGAFGFDDCNFCGPSCAKGYLTWYAQVSPMLLTWLHIFVHRDLKIPTPIPIAPSPRLLACNNKFGKGLTTKQFREFENSHKLAEVISHLPLDFRVWVAQPQVNSEVSFYEVYRDQKLLADMLYADALATGAPIPKTIINDIKAAEEAEAQEKLQGINAIAAAAAERDAQLLENDEDSDFHQQTQSDSEEKEPTKQTKKPKPKTAAIVISQTKKAKQKLSEERSDSESASTKPNDNNSDSETYVKKRKAQKITKPTKPTTKPIPKAKPITKRKIPK